LSTHGPFFAPPVRKFSIKGADAGSLTEETVLAEQRRRYYSQENTLPEFAVQFDHYEVPPEKRAAHWNTYDDAILSVDHYFGKIMNMLRETGRLENSLIVFFTDHGMGYFTTDVDKVRFPLPLIVRLPDRQGQTVLDKPVQYLDIAPSILAYLDQPIPEWMEGHVIFKKSMDAFDLPNRALVTAGFLTENAQPAGRLGFHYAVKAANVGPPYFGMDLFGVATQDHYYLYSTELGSGGLYDVSANPYDFREISDRALEDDYYNRLYQYLAERGIHLREEPA
jgi:hypothetical protein